MNYQHIKSNGFSGDTQGFCGAFSWLRCVSKPGFWHVIAYEPGFSSDGYAVTDDFGNLVRVTA